MDCPSLSNDTSPLPTPETHSYNRRIKPSVSYPHPQTQNPLPLRGRVRVGVNPPRQEHPTRANPMKTAQTQPPQKPPKRRQMGGKINKIPPLPPQISAAPKAEARENGRKWGVLGGK